MLFNLNFLLILKYVICISIVLGIFLAPAWLARQTGKDKYDNMIIRSASWLFGWTIVGWLFALYRASRK